MFIEPLDINNEIKEIPSFSQATESEITWLLNLHRQNIIDLTQYWTVGDTKFIHINAMTSSVGGLIDTYPAQDIAFTIMHGPDAFDLSDSEGGGKNIFVVGMPKILIYNTDYSGYQSARGLIPYSNSDKSTNVGGYAVTPRRTWCDEVFREALPTEVKKWFKKFKYKSSDGGGLDTSSILENYFVIPSASNLFGPSYNTTYMPVSEDEIQFDWYKTKNNRLIYDSTFFDSVSNSYNSYILACTRTPRANENKYFLYDDNNGNFNNGGYYNTNPVLPLFGVV